MAIQLPVPEKYRAMPLVVHFSQWLTENAARLLPIFRNFSAFTDYCAAKNSAGEPVKLQEMATLVSSCVPPDELIGSEIGLGSWIKNLPVEVPPLPPLPPLPKQVWELLDMLLDGLKISADDLRFIYNNNLGTWRENMDRWVEQARSSFLGGNFLGDTKGAEAIVLVADVMIGVAEFIGKHPPDHVIEAIAESRGVKIDTLDEKKRFAIKCMLARDQLLKGTPWEQPTLRAKDWRIGIKDAILLRSIQSQWDGHHVDFRVEQGRVVDVALIPKASPPDSKAISAPAGSSAAEAESRAPGDAPSLSEKQRMALDFIREKGPVKGVIIARHLDIEADTFRKHYVPALKRHGLKNDGDGYYIPSG